MTFPRNDFAMIAAESYNEKTQNAWSALRFDFTWEWTSGG
jgi:hypothetical protein